MLFRILIVCFIGALNFSASSIAMADTRSETFSAIKAACAHFDSSFNQRDLPGYTDGIDNEFLGMAPEQKDIHGLAEEAESLQSLLDQEKSVTCTTRLLTLTVYEDGVVTTTAATYTPGSGSKAVTRVDTQRRFWVQVNGKWLVKRERLLSRTLTPK